MRNWRIWAKRAMNRRNSCIRNSLWSCKAIKATNQRSKANASKPTANLPGISHPMKLTLFRRQGNWEALFRTGRSPGLICWRKMQTAASDAVSPWHAFLNMVAVITRVSKVMTMMIPRISILLSIITILHRKSPKTWQIWIWPNEDWKKGDNWENNFGEIV